MLLSLSLINVFMHTQRRDNMIPKERNIEMEVFIKTGVNLCFFLRPRAKLQLI